MSLISDAVTQEMIKRAAFSLLAVILAIVAVAFLTASAYIGLAFLYGSALSAFIVGASYLVMAMLVLLLKPRKVEKPDNIGIGLALGTSFVEGFSAARRVKR